MSDRAFEVVETLPVVFKEAFDVFIVPPTPPGAPEGGSGLSFSYRSRGFVPDPGRGVCCNLNLYFDLIYSRELMLPVRSRASGSGFYM